PAEAESLARSAGPAALEAGPLALRARALGVGLAPGAIGGGGLGPGGGRGVQRGVGAGAAAPPPRRPHGARRPARPTRAPPGRGGAPTTRPSARCGGP